VKDKDWQSLVKRETILLIEIAIPMVRAALIVILFVLLEGLIMFVMEFVLITPRPSRLQERIEPVVDEIALWSVVGIAVFYALYVIGEIVQQVRRHLTGE